MRIVWRLLQSRVIAAAILAGALIGGLDLRHRTDRMFVWVDGMDAPSIDTPRSISLEGTLDLNLGNQSFTDKDGKFHTFDLRHSHKGWIDGR